MQHISSRQNAVVKRCRAVAKGDESRFALLDGLHLVSEAVAAGVRISEAIVAADSLDQAAVKTLLDALASRHVPIASASSQVMDAVSPVRSPTAIVAIA